MKTAFRLGWIIIPFMFLLSTTAQSAGAPGHHSKFHKHSRSPASVESGASGHIVKLNQIASLDQISRPAPLEQSQVIRLASQAQGVTPPYGNGMGVAAPVFKW